MPRDVDVLADEHAVAVFRREGAWAVEGVARQNEAGRGAPEDTVVRVEVDHRHPVDMRRSRGREADGEQLVVRAQPLLNSGQWRDPLADVEGAVLQRLRVKWMRPGDRQARSNRRG